MKRSDLCRAALAAMALTCMACSSVRSDPPEQTSGGATGSGSTGGTTSSSSASSSGSGGEGGHGGEGGQPPTMACVEPFIDVIGDGPDQHYVHPCSGSVGQTSPGPWGTLLHDQLTGAVTLLIEGCADAGLPSARLSVSRSDATEPGEYDDANMYYTDAANDSHDALPPGAKLVVSELGDVGGVIEGTFDGAIEDEGFPMQLNGSFRVCRIDDVYGE